jgi:hypothetical protein
MDGNKHEYISEALKIVDELLELANNKEALGDENGCGVLSGVLRDCGYKIRQAAENAAGKGEKNWRKPVEPVLVIFAVAVLSVVFALPANATVILSTTATETLGGLTFGKDDLAEYNQGTDTGTLYFDGGALFSFTNEDIDAVHVLGNGNIVLSTIADATLGGLSFTDGDLIEYNPGTDTATLLLDESLFTGDENIDAAYVRSNGNIILSTVDAGRIGGLNFSEGDLIEYNLGTDTATLFLDGTLFIAASNIDAAHVLGSGNVVLSTTANATLGGLSFSIGDLVEYNPGTDTATLYFAETNFSTAANIDAAYISVPEPATVALLGLGSLVLVRRKKR